MKLNEKMPSIAFVAYTIGMACAMVMLVHCLPVRIPQIANKQWPVCINDLNHCGLTKISASDTAYANRRKIKNIRYVASKITESPVMLLEMK